MDKRQQLTEGADTKGIRDAVRGILPAGYALVSGETVSRACLLYTSDAADDLLCVDLGGRRILKKKNTHNNTRPEDYTNRSCT